jgi:hypothetical protein
MTKSLRLARGLVLLMMVALGAAACTSSTQVRLPPRAKLLEYEKIHSKIRRFATLEEGRRLATCNGLVFVGRSHPAPGAAPTDLDEIEIADGPAVYFDNRTGRKIADCSYWFCVKNNAFCNARCPVREWTCHGLDTGKPETAEQLRLRAVGFIKRPSKSEMRSLEGSVQLPETAKPLANYFRYYYAIPQSGKRLIVGKYIATHLMPNVAKSEDDAGVVVDGENTIPRPPGTGCDLVNVVYDPSERTITSVACAGT